jgi:hypothetical protein
MSLGKKVGIIGISPSTQTATSYGMQVKATVPAPSAYYPCDEASGTNINDEIGNNDGTAGVGVTVNRTSLIPDGEGKSIEHSSAVNTAGVRIPYAAAINLTTAGTINMWTYRTNVGAAQMWWAKDGCAGERLGVAITADFKLSSYERGTTSGTKDFTTAASNTGTHMWTFCWTTTNAKVYVDGTLLSSTSSWATMGDDGEDAYFGSANMVGCDQDSADLVRYQGVAIWTTELTADQIQQLWIAGSVQ